ncbi:MAG TPA: glycosyltransferase family 4 protein, partial [Jatrophihabitans sp.]|nr:glycosyltransferase family 4 protein [Jatrophihabitans sp.]
SRRGRHTDVVVDVQNGVPFFAPLVRPKRPVVNLLHHVHREQWQIIYPGLIGHLGWWLEPWVAPRVYRGLPYLTVSEATRTDLIGLGVRDSDISVVYNGIDVPHPDHVAPRSPVPTVCVLGRLVPHKQVEHALEAAARIRREHRSVRFEIVGDGWWRERLERRAHELAVDDVVTFHGAVSDPQRDRLLDRSWVLLAPSIKEGWGIAIMEAAARGVPAIAYASAGGVRESILDGTTGVLVDDLDELVKRTAELLGDGEKRADLGDRARDRAAAFSWAGTGDTVSRILADVRRRYAGN